MNSHSTAFRSPTSDMRQNQSMQTDLVYLLTTIHLDSDQRRGVAKILSTSEALSPDLRSAQQQTAGGDHQSQWLGTYRPS